MIRASDTPQNRRNVSSLRRLTASSANAELFRAYGLLFDSDFPIPEMTAAGSSQGPSSVGGDVRIRLGRTPEHLDAPLSRSKDHEEDAERFLMWIEGVGRYLVTGGTEIVVEPAPGADPHEVRVFLLGTGLGVLLHQRGFLVLHASGIGTGDGAVLFAGESGAGKSTLLAELLRRGYRMLVDDVCAISLTSGAPPTVVPSYPRTRLWGTTAARLSIDTSGLTRTRPQMDKYERQLPDQFWDQTAPLARIYHLTGHDEDGFSLTDLEPMDAFQTVLENTYRERFLDGLARRREHFDLAARVARAAQVIRVRRPIEGFRLQELADLIEEDMRSAGRAARR